MTKRLQKSTRRPICERVLNCAAAAQRLDLRHRQGQLFPQQFIRMLTQQRRWPECMRRRPVQLGRRPDQPNFVAVVPSVTVCTICRCRAWGVSRAVGISLTGPQGTPAVHSRSIHSSVEPVRKWAANAGMSTSRNCTRAGLIVKKPDIFPRQRVGERHGCVIVSYQSCDCGDVFQWYFSHFPFDAIHHLQGACAKRAL